MNILHLVKVRFDRRTAVIDQAWFDKRCQHFKRWTLPSLKAQTLKDWVLWINCDNVVTGKMVANSFGVDHPHLPLSLAKHLGVPLLDSCGDSSPASSPGIRNRIIRCDAVYVTRIDSDDLYAPDALALANAARPRSPGLTEASVFKLGYMHDLKSGQTGAYRNPSSPFHTIMFSKPDFVDPYRYDKVFQLIGDHSRVAHALPCQSLPDWKFTVLVHDHNFLTDMSYCSEPQAPIEAAWTPDWWLSQPVVFDVDDFCDKWDCLPQLTALKRQYPHFKCTLFTIPNKTSLSLLRAAKAFDWIELAVHGFDHEPDDEVLKLSKQQMVDNLDAMRHANMFLDGRGNGFYVRGFRPPCWHLSSDLIEACNDALKTSGGNHALNHAGLWVAMHDRDRAHGRHCENGFYTCGARLPYSHHHTHDVCGNWIVKDLPQLLTQWPVDQKFALVSEAVLKPQQVGALKTSGGNHAK